MEWDGRDNPLRKTLGRNVRARRLELEMTQEALAQDCELDSTYVSAIERGLRNPSVDVIAKLAVGLRVPAWVLMRPKQS